jgi:hypothetical protein
MSVRSFAQLCRFRAVVYSPVVGAPATDDLYRRPNGNLPDLSGTISRCRLRDRAGWVRAVATAATRVVGSQRS